MLFNSVEFVLFFPLVCFVFWRLPRAYAFGFLLAASYVFYGAWRPEYLLLIVASTLVDFIAGRNIARTDSVPIRRAWLLASLGLNLGLLAVFKYGGFVLENVRAFAGLPPPAIPELAGEWLILPVGISFYTFQTMSYTIDVYTRKRDAEPRLDRFALYVAFFPQLVAGPIERSTRLLPQLETPKPFEYDRVVNGLRLVLWGMFKKVVVADRLAEIADPVYADPAGYPSVMLIVATFAFTLQIYADFSGYTDIAIGCARVLGVELMGNFDRPYTAKSIGEFWQRWHISLTTWFRDYVYVPLGGNQAGVARMYRNVLAVFLLSGLWHGANWTFILWGAYHAGLYFVVRGTRPIRERLAEAMSLGRTPQWMVNTGLWAVTILAVAYGWVFFRADSLSDALMVGSRVFQPMLGLDALAPAWVSLAVSKRWFVITAVATAFMLMAERRLQLAQPPALLCFRQPVVRWAVYLMLVLTIFRFGGTDEQPFIYFQF